MIDTLALLFANTADSQSETVAVWILVLASIGNMVATIVAVVKGQLERTQARADRESEAHAASEIREVEWTRLREQREQDRFDAESKARIALLEAQAREARLSAKIDAGTEASKQAMDTANGYNEKIKTAVETVAGVAKVLVEAAPKEVHVTVEKKKQ